MKHTPPASSPWTLKSQQEITDFLSGYAERNQQPLPTTFKDYLGLFTDNSDGPAVRYLRKSQIGVLGAIWRVAFLMTMPMFVGTSLAMTLRLSILLAAAISWVLSLTLALGPTLYAKIQLSRVYYIDIDRVTRDFKNVLRPRIRQYNRGLKSGRLSPHDDVAPLAASIFDFQTLYPASPQAPLPERAPMPWGAPENPYRPDFVTSVLEDRRSSGMRYMFEQESPQRPLYSVSLSLDQMFASPLLKISVSYLVTVLIFVINQIIRFPPLTAERFGGHLLIGMLGPVLFYARKMRYIPYLMQDSIGYYSPSGDTQSITFWSLYKAFRREVLPSVKAARKNLILPSELEQVYARFRARYPLIDPDSLSSE